MMSVLKVEQRLQRRSRWRAVTTAFILTRRQYPNGAQWKRMMATSTPSPRSLMTLNHFRSTFCMETSAESFVRLVLRVEGADFRTPDMDGGVAGC